MKRRDFVKTVAISGMAVAASDLVGDLIAQTPQGKPLESKFKGLADVALRGSEAHRLHLCRHPLHAADQLERERERRQQRLRGLRRVRAAAAAAGAAAGARRWRRRRWLRRRGRDLGPGAAGFGVRVIHSGVWGFASSPIVTEDEIRRITRIATEVAKASAIAKRLRRDARAGARPTPSTGPRRSSEESRRSLSQDDKQALVQKRRRRRGEEQGSRRASTPRSASSTSGSTSRAPRAPTSSRRSGPYAPSFTVTARKDGRDAIAHLHRRDDDGRLGDRRARPDARERRTHRRRGGRVLHRQAGRDGRQGSDPDRRRTRC